MCTTPTSRHPLSLDDLGLLVRHPRATPAIEAAFSRALVRWTAQRVLTITRRMWNFSAADRDDLAQAFMLRCLVRHLPRWEPTKVALSPYLYRRLHGDVIDALRNATRQQARCADVDPDTVVDDVLDRDAWIARLHVEALLADVDAAVEVLPRRQRQVVRRSFGGERLCEVAEGLGVHASTVSRERTAALTTLRRHMVQVTAMAA